MPSIERNGGEIIDNREGAEKEGRRERGKKKDTLSINYGTVIALKGNDNGYCGWELEISKPQSIERKQIK